MSNNVVTATFAGETFLTTDRLWKGDYGQILNIRGLELPQYYEVHFASTKGDTPQVEIGTPTGVTIPNKLLRATGYIYAWLFLHAGDNDGETKYQIKIPVEEKGIPIDQETPEEKTAIQQAIEELNTGLSKAEAAVKEAKETAADVERRVNSGEFDGVDGYTPIKGVDYFDGLPGKDGAPGAPGADGYSPSAKVERTSDGAVITITDKRGTTTAIVNDGQGGGSDVTDEHIRDVAETESIKEALGTAVKTHIKEISGERVTEYLLEDMTSGLVRPDGTIGTGGRYVYEKIPVSAGETLSARAYYLDSKNNRVYGDYNRKILGVCAFVGDTIVESKGAAYDNKRFEYVVPDDVTSIIPTIYYQSQTFKHIEIVVNGTGSFEKTYIMRQRTDGNPLRYVGSIEANNPVSLGFEHCWTNKVWMFSGLTSAFAPIKIGSFNQTTQQIVRPYIEVTATAVNIYSSVENWDKSFEHGLTIEHDINVYYEQGRSLYAKTIIVQSHGQRWELSVGNQRVGEPYHGIGMVTEGAFADATFAVAIEDLNKPVWVFGDSWVSMYDTRWVGQAVKLGLDKGWLLDGYAGRTSKEAVRSLETLIEMHQPKMIVWLLGMNDEDPNDTTPNANWLEALARVEEICELYDIKLVLATIPSVPASQGDYTGSARNNNAKNDYVRNSGYRYVDQVSALGADSNGNWIEGYWQSNTDHTHPSELGARALMMQIFADVPEMVTANDGIAAAGSVDDVQINGTSIVVDGVANIPCATDNVLGAVKAGWSGGIQVGSAGQLLTSAASSDNISSRNQQYRPITSTNIDFAVKAAMTDGKGVAWSEEEQRAAQLRIGIISSEGVGF